MRESAGYVHVGDNSRDAKGRTPTSDDPKFWSLESDLALEHNNQTSILCDMS